MALSVGTAVRSVGLPVSTVQVAVVERASQSVTSTAVFTATGSRLTSLMMRSPVAES